MKKRKFILAPVLLALSLVFTGCGEKPDTTYNGITRDELEQGSEAIATALVQLSTENVDQYVSQYEKSMNATTNTSEKEQYKIYYDMMSGWADTAPVVGEFKGFSSFKVENAGKTIVTTLTMHFSKRDATLVTTYTKYNMQISAINVNAVYSVGEKMSKAGLNTIMAICIVFAVLIILSLLIYAFKLIPYFQKKYEEKQKASEGGEGSANAGSTAPSAGNDAEIAAAIAAALAYENDMSIEEFTDSFVVRSIRRI